LHHFFIEKALELKNFILMTIHNDYFRFSNK